MMYCLVSQRLRKTFTGPKNGLFFAFCGMSSIFTIPTHHLLALA